MKQLAVLAGIFLLLGLGACSKSDNSNTSSTTSDNQTASSASNTTSNQTASTSNTGVTASDQPSNDADMKVVQDVRKALTSDDSLSTAAHNVTVVSTNGNVTLRGSVKDQSEKQKVQEKAMQVAGVTNVDNQLTVTQ
ncbi:MAG TPA: BON domain-containing protein [Candidatus Binatia bacterium]